jgi:hypothetical protein
VAYPLTFRTTGVGNTFTTNSVAGTYYPYFTGNGAWTLGSDVNTNGGHFFLGVGTLNTGNKTVTAGEFQLAGNGVKVLTTGSSTVNCNAWLYFGTNLTLTANTSTIKVTGTGAFTSTDGIATYNNVELNGTAHTVSGTNTFAKLSFKPAAGQTITFTDTTTQTAASFERTGTGQIVFQGSAAAGWALTDNNGGTNTLNAVTVSRCTASGATFNCTTSSLNSGNNVGLTFPTTLTTQATTGIGGFTATANGTTTDQGGSVITERGFVWNTTGLPTTGDHKVIVAGTLGVYTGTLTGVMPSSPVYVRSYLTNGSGTSYGNETSFMPAFTQSSSQVGYIGIPLVFMLLGLVLVFNLGFSESVDIKSLIFIAIVIIIMFAMLAMMQPQLNALP